MKIAAHTRTMRIPKLETYDANRRMGLEGVQIGVDMEFLAYPDGKIEEIKARCKENGLTISAICGDIGGHAFQTRGENMKRAEFLCRVVDLAERLETHVITTHIGVIPEDGNDPVYPLMLESIRHAANYAAPRNVTFAIETGPEKPETLKAFIEEVDSRGLGVNLDHLHLGWYQIVILFFLGSMAGLLIEEVWMLATAGLTENRVGLVWGPFSPLYGLGAVLLTLLSFFLRSRGARAWQVFLVSALVGGVLEQLTGWSMSTFFDAESWTYLHLPDHITQWVAWRFLAFWGLLGLTWSRAVMPRLLYTIGMPTTRRQAVFVTLVAVYLVADIAMTLVCFDRKTERDAGIPPANAFEQWVDTNYSDEFIAARFENLKIGDARDKVDADGNIILDDEPAAEKDEEVRP